jgi:hypothetical protein
MKIFQCDVRRNWAFNALSEATAQLIPIDDDRWQFTIGEESRLLVDAKVSDDWLILAAKYPADRYGSESSWETLGRNALLTGLAKLVLEGDGELGLHAEIPLVEGADLVGRIQEVQAGFKSVCFPAVIETGIDSSPAENERQPDLKSLCSEAGWVFTERSGGKFAVELEVPGSFYQAHLIPQHHGFRVTCELMAFESVSEETRQSIADLLLGASAFVRMTRASVTTNQTAPVAQFEVVFGTAPSPSELSSALECLSTGCSLCGEEIKMLQTPAIAERYLALRGWGADA